LCRDLPDSNKRFGVTKWIAAHDKECTMQNTPDEASRDERLLPEGALFAKLDQLAAVQDYAPELPCLRLFGVRAADFKAATFNESAAEVFLLDISWDDLSFSASREILRPLEIANHLHRYADDEDLLETHFGNTWIEVRYSRSNRRTGSYGYCMFREITEPTYVTIEMVRFVAGPPIEPPETIDANAEWDDMGGSLSVMAFHVGQGMCSLISDGESGVLLDCGAGTPIKRPDYIARALPDGRPFINELHTETRHLRPLDVIVSHADSDHWRLLDWDTGLAGLIKRIITPIGLPILPLKSPALAGKVFSAGDHTMKLGGAILSVFRTSPAVSDRNGEALLAWLNLDGRSALFPGDYVYGRMAADSNASISGLSTSTWDAVVVPHHGCSKSALSVPLPAVVGRSKAFVSAGTHGKFRHPRFDSLEAHSDAGYRVINDHTARHVFAHRLLP